MVQSPREFAAQKRQLLQQQEGFLRELLDVLDALDHACEHWQQAEQTQMATAENLGPLPPSLWQRLLTWLNRTPAPSPADTTGPLVSSARQGVDMIRRSLLETLGRYQVTPIAAVGQPFDPTDMYAVGRQESTTALAGTVLQEVVRGYRWQNRVLREAQVVVAVAASDRGDESVE
ncbi:MAG: nucleotide exchange factor GrpE [Nodosilinea sp.]